MSVRDAYDRWSTSYDLDPNATRDLDGELLRGLSLPWRELDALEIGCGTGKNSAFLAERCRSLVGLDLSPGMLAVARGRVTGARFVEADLAERWPVDAHSADVVLADLVLEHLADVGHVFREVARVLRPGGWDWVSELHPYRQLRGGQAHFVADGVRVDVPAVTHSVSEYVNAALAAGLRLERLGEHARGDEPPRLLTLLLRRP